MAIAALPQEDFALRARRLAAHPGLTIWLLRPTASASGGTDRVMQEPAPI